MACKNDNKKEVAKAETPATDLIVEEEVDEMPNESDYDFAEAFDAFEDGGYDVAITYINSAIEDLREEAADLDVKGKAKVEASIKKLQKLNTEIKAAEEADEGTEENSDDLADKLADAFANAEMTVAHDYLVFSNIYLLEEPEKAESAFNTAIYKMESAAAKMKGAAKTEAAKIIAESKALIDEEGVFIQKEGTKAGKSIDTQLDKIGAWLRKHGKDTE